MRHPAGFNHRFAFPSLLFIFALAVTFPTFAQSTNNNVRAVRISYVEGTVRLLDDKGVVFDQAHANMPVTQGMRIKTGGDGRVEIQFEDGSVARATPNSALIFEQLQRTAEGKTVTRLIAAEGITYFEINNRGGSYAVNFGPYSVSATKDSVFRVALDSGPAQLAVMRGSIHVGTGSENGIDVAKDQTVTFDMANTANPSIAQAVTPATGDIWNYDRDKLIGEIGARASIARTVTGNPDDPAWNDLDYYGRWYNVPGYGPGWMPVGMGAGWDPFGSGYWGYYPAYGWTWVSANPWGWLPYHCGAWNWFDGSGWMWFPGNCGWGAFGSGWYPVTTVWNVPPHYVPLKRPTTPLKRHEHIPPPKALIAVNHEPGKSELRRVGNKPGTMPIKIDGKTLHPLEASIHPRVSGPLGESFHAASGLRPPLAQGPRSGALPVQNFQSFQGIHNIEGMHNVALPSPGTLAIFRGPHNSIAPVMPRGGTLSASPHFSPPPAYHPSAPVSGAMMTGSAHYSYSGHYAAPSSGSFSSASHYSAPASVSAPASSGSVSAAGGGAHAR